MKRSFLLKSATAHTAPDFDLRQVASTSGRLDIISRCIIAAFTGPKGLRTDVRFAAVLEGPPHPPLTLETSSDQLTELPRDEVKVASSIFNAMSSQSLVNGFTLRRGSFEQVVRVLHRSKRRIFYLHEGGKDLESLRDRSFEEIGFILGDQIGLSAESEKLLDSMRVPRISIGPRSYLSSSCIIFINSLLDTL